MPLREIYYSAWDAGTYHTCESCPVGKGIPLEYVRKTFYVPSFCHKCEVCDKMESERKTEPEMCVLSFVPTREVRKV